MYRYGCKTLIRKAAFSTGPDTMVDFIFGVTHAHHWHSLNLRQNPSHYSFLSMLGSDAVVHVQERMGARIYYNPDVVVNGLRIKYGVVSIHHLQRDLEEWETLYLAGRLQKPVRLLRQDAKLGLASKKNLENAVRVSLLMLPERFTEEELFLKIAGLSYSGDFRMLVGENPHKVYNIVYAQMDAFRQQYDPIIQELPNVNRLADGTLEQDLSIKLRGSLMLALPGGLRERIKSHYLWALSKEGRKTISESDREEPTFSQAMGQYGSIDAIARKSIRDIVAFPALTQSLKGILTAGVIKSVKYAGEKVGKQLGAKK
ncbi:Mitochondrial translocator assembly and maintenance protein 41 [Kappamyces sp. JEL0829]|nr:Mitochondrial translocator assembly and maintenance protein 41 [Kappamyces sp. JEL0829]